MAAGLGAQGPQRASQSGEQSGAAALAVDLFEPVLFLELLDRRTPAAQLANTEGGGAASTDDWFEQSLAALPGDLTLVLGGADIELQMRRCASHGGHMQRRKPAMVQEIA